MIIYQTFYWSISMMKRMVQSIFFLLIFSIAISSYSTIPRPEHPRPDCSRSEWLNLNGQWKFSFDPNNLGETQQWYLPTWYEWPLRITVPYPWESALSGIKRPDYSGVAWYRRDIAIPNAWNNKNVFLIFSAVDWSAKVWIDGEPLGNHSGGYTPFEFQIPAKFQDGKKHTLVVKAADFTDRKHPVGKQVGWYTTTSGIWQTVYMEARGSKDASYITDFEIVQELSNDTDGSPNADITIKVKTNTNNLTDLSVEVVADTPPDTFGKSASINDAYVIQNKRGFNRTVGIKNPQLWSVESPTLYFIKINLKKNDEIVDSLRTYFGIRDVSISNYKDQEYKSIHLNGKPFYVLSALNQSFHPDGIHTFPSDDVIRKDIEDAKHFGFNNLRIHIKIDEPRLYYWADRLGMTILYDFPCFRECSDEAKSTFEYTLRKSIARDINHPSILAWVIFNETWGLNLKKNREHVTFLKEMYNLTKQLDSTRIVEDNSPNKRDHVITDLNSWHFYIYDHFRARNHIEQVVKDTYPGSSFNYVPGYKQGDEPLINSEYGGISAGMGDRDISWCFHYLTNELRRHPKIGGYVYTELQDIEWEHNGFMNYDRTYKDFGYEDFVPVPAGHPPFTYRDINTLDYVVIDQFAGGALNESRHDVPIALSLYSGTPSGEYHVNWNLYGFQPNQDEWNEICQGSSSIQAEAFTVTKGKPIQLRVSDVVYPLYTLYVWVEDNHNQCIARNFWTFYSNKKQDKSDSLSVRWNPNDYQQYKGEIDRFPNGLRDSLSIPGESSVTYKISLPEKFEWKEVDQCKLLIELSACADDERVEWKDRIRRKSTPQTDIGKLFPSTIDVLIDGEKVSSVFLPNDPADYRGILSNIHKSAPPSSYGYFKHIQIPIDLIRDKSEFFITLKTQDKTNGGIRVFGKKSGRIPEPPSLVFSNKE
jgi:hypothetical protein